MQTIELNRGDLLELLGGRLPNHRLTARSFWSTGPSHGSVLAVWPDAKDPLNRVPYYLVTPHSEKRDTVAWLSTYIGNLQPFSAFCHIVEWEEWASLEQKRVPIEEKSLESVFSGLVLAEALTHGRNSIDLNVVSSFACRSTYSFARGRMAWCFPTLRPHLKPSLAERWTLTRELAGQHGREPNAYSVEKIWHLWEHVTGIALDPPQLGQQLIRSVKQLRADGRLSEKAILELSEGLFPWSEWEREFLGTREQRLAVFLQATKILESLPTPRKASSETSFLVAYVASRMSPGTMDYAQLVESHLGSFPEALLWYGLCEGIAHGSMVSTAYAGLGTRLLRDIFAAGDIIVRPVADIGITEFQAIVDAKALSRYRFGQQPTLQVELFPLVDTVVRLGSASIKVTQPAEVTPNALAAANIMGALDNLRVVIERELRVRAQDRQLPKQERSRRSKSRFFGKE